MSATARADSASAARKAVVGPSRRPGPRAHRRSARRRACRRGPGRGRARRAGDRWRRRGRGPGIPLGQRVEQLLRGDRLRDPHALVHPVELPEDRRGRQPALGDREDPVEGPADLQRPQLLAPSDTQRRPAHQAERHVTAQLGADVEEFLAGGVRPPQGVAGEQRAGAVGAAARHAARDGDVLGDVEVDPRFDAVPAGEFEGRAGRQVVASRGTWSASGPSQVIRSLFRWSSPATSSYSPTARKTLARSWKPSGRAAPTASWTLTLAGTRTVTTSVPCAPARVRRGLGLRLRHG